MTISKSIEKAAAAVLAAACLWALNHVPHARAQVVADDVQCSQCVGKGDIVDKSITAVKIKSNSIFSPKIQDRSIEGIDIAIGAVGTEEIADGGVTGADIAGDTMTRSDFAPDAVGASKIAEGAVGSSEIIDGNLFMGDLAPDSVGRSEIADGAVVGDAIQTGAVGSSEVVDNTIRADDLAADSVGHSELGTGAVSAIKVQNDSLTALHRLDEVGVDFSGGLAPIEITNVGKIVRSVTLTSPTKGSFVIFASGTFDEVGNSGSTHVRCSVSNGGSTIFEFDMIQARLTATMDRMPFATLDFYFRDAGTYTFNLVCDVFEPIGGTANVVDPQISVLFFASET